MYKAIYGYAISEIVGVFSRAHSKAQIYQIYQGTCSIVNVHHLIGINIFLNRMHQHASNSSIKHLSCLGPLFIMNTVHMYRVTNGNLMVTILFIFRMTMNVWHYDDCR